jgi:hypothetical protein
MLMRCDFFCRPLGGVLASFKRILATMYCDQSIGVGLVVSTLVEDDFSKNAAIERRGEFHDQATRVPANAIVAFVALKNSAACWFMEVCFKSFQMDRLGVDQSDN